MEAGPSRQGAQPPVHRAEDGSGRRVGIVSSRDFLSYIVDELEGLIEQANVELRREEPTDPYGLL